MQAIPFEQAVEAITQRDGRFHPQAFMFLKEALDHTVKKTSAKDPMKMRHVTGGELLEGLRELAVTSFGPMAATLMREWGVTKCSDVGEMVFLLIEEQIFGKQDSDSMEDFKEIYTFHDAFVLPYLPKNQASAVGAKSEA